jgi:hypothetical protein
VWLLSGASSSRAREAANAWALAHEVRF